MGDEGDGEYTVKDIIIGVGCSIIVCVAITVLWMAMEGLI